MHRAISILNYCSVRLPTGSCRTLLFQLRYSTHSYYSPFLSFYYLYTSVDHRPLGIPYTYNSVGSQLLIVSCISYKYYYTFFSMTFGRKKPDKSSGLIRQLFLKDQVIRISLFNIVYSIRNVNTYVTHKLLGFIQIS